tara:strand:- start:1070 stop:1564 length:495 start_codon:yes stop_codon:yes gene_type:complete
VKIISTSYRGNFIYERGEKKILELVHPKWFSKKAVTKYDNTNIKVEPKNYWGKTYRILKEGVEKGSIDVDWKSSITIAFIDQHEIAHTFKMTKKGFWKQQFEFSNLKGEIVIVLTPLNTWKKWTNDLAVESSPKYSDQKYFDELVVYCGFVVRLIQQYAGAGVV